MELNDKQQDSLFMIFDYMCNRDDRTINAYIDELRELAKILDVSDRDFREMTGHTIASEEDRIRYVLDNYCD